MILRNGLSEPKETKEAMRDIGAVPGERFGETPAPAKRGIWSGDDQGSCTADDGYQERLCWAVHAEVSPRASELAQRAPPAGVGHSDRQMPLLDT